MRLSKSSPATAFSLVESTIAIAISVLFLSSVFAMNLSALDSIRGAKESVASSQVLQQRIESLRIANWQQITSASWLAANTMNANAAGAEILKNLSETLVLVPYSSATVGNTTLTRTNNSTSIVSQNAALLTENAVKVIWTLNFTGAPNSRQISRQIVAILAKGGVAK